MTTITEAEAKAAGYWPVTFKIELPRERDLVDSIVSNFAGTGHRVVLVQQDQGVSVWRDGPRDTYQGAIKTAPMAEGHTHRDRLKQYGEIKERQLAPSPFRRQANDAFARLKTPEFWRED